MTEDKQSAAPQCFLIDHGEFYGKEILHGLVFVSDRQSAERKLIRSVRPGDLFFHRSARGVSAVGRARSFVYRAPFPHWRRREAGAGEMGFFVEVEPLLLPEPIAVQKSEPALLLLLKREDAARFLRQIPALLPGGSCADWAEYLFDNLPEAT